MQWVLLMYFIRLLQVSIHCNYLKAISSCCEFQDKATFKILDLNLVLWRQTLQIFEFQYTLYHNLLMAVSYGDSVLHEGDR